MAEYRVILSQQFTEIYFSGSIDTNNLDILLYNHYINVNRHGLYLLDYVISDWNILSSIICVVVAG